MSRSEDAGRLANDLESLRNGTLLASAFREKYHPTAAPRLLNVIWPMIEHYLADFDIRKRDLEYRDMQDGEMEKLIRLLRDGASDAELAKIHFLGRS